MAQQTINTIRQWFMSRSRPRQDQFWDWFDSFRHKDEMIPGEIVDGMKEALDNKLSLSEAGLIDAKADDALGRTATLDGDMSTLRAEMSDADATLGVGVAKNSEDITALQHNLDNACDSIYVPDGEVEEAVNNANAARDAANGATTEANMATATATAAAAAGSAAIAAKQDELIAGEGITIDADGRKISSIGGGGGSEAPTIVTYIVDSDEALAAWCHNAGGNDYSCVLIKAGTWTLDSGIELGGSGTYVVVGEPGNRLHLRSSVTGLGYEDLPTSSGYWMYGVNVTNSNPEGSCFWHCINLTNCTSNSSVEASGTSAYGFHKCANLTTCTGNGNRHGFSSCTNLTNCAGTGTSVLDGGTGFSGCANLTNCTGSGSSKKDTTNKGYGFSGCTNLTNCKGSGSGGYGYGFFDCTGLSNCTGSGSGNSGGPGYGFSNCTDLTNCTGIGSGAPNGSYGCGFIDCINLINCTGKGEGFSGSAGYGFYKCSGLTTCAGTGTGYGGYSFFYCRIMFGCYPSEIPLTEVYAACYMNKNDIFNPVGDTYSGGYNRTTV